MPRVSLGMPVYNGERYVAQAVQSILAQEFADFELVITDNASTDATEQICRSFVANDPRIRYVRNDRNLGATANFNKAFELSRAPYFKWCAHDDLLSPNYIGECIRALDDDQRAVLAFGRLVGIDASGDLNGYIERTPADMSGMTPAQRFSCVVSQNGMDAFVFGLYRRNALAVSSLHRRYFSSDCALIAEIALLGTYVRVPNITLYNRNHAHRSVRLHRNDRISWVNPDARANNAFELSQRVAHLVEIAWRHRATVPAYSTLPRLACWTLHPVLIGRLALEAVGVVSPRMREALRSVGLKVLDHLASFGWGPRDRNTKPPGYY